MSLIYAKPVGRDRWRVFCEACLLPTDVVSDDELSGLARGDYHVFCLQCDGVSPEYHPVFKWDGVPFWVVIDEALFKVDWPASFKEQQIKYDKRVRSLVKFLEEVKPENTSSLACLVSTYLHTTIDNGGSND